MDISKCYLMIPLGRPEHIRINLKDISEKIIKEYKLRDTTMTNGSVHIIANRGMCDFLQSGFLANELFENVSTKGVLTKVSWYQDCGNMNSVQYTSPW